LIPSNHSTISSNPFDEAINKQELPSCYIYGGGGGESYGSIKEEQKNRNKKTNSARKDEGKIL
jgi:PHP family Zn ribbon phosphoesterase